MYSLCKRNNPTSFDDYTHVQNNKGHKTLCTCNYDNLHNNSYTQWSDLPLSLSRDTCWQIRPVALDTMVTGGDDSRDTAYKEYIETL